MAELEVNQLEKALAGITIGTIKNVQRAEEQAEKDGLREREEQFQITVSGTAEEFAGWQTAEIKFGTAFVDATGNRDSELTQPHFTYGAKLDTDIPVGLVAVVMEWLTTERNETIGCVIAVGVLSTDQATRFKGAIHATFQGFGQPILTYEPEGLGAEE